MDPVLLIKRTMKPVFFIAVTGACFLDCQKEAGPNEPSTLPFEVTPVSTAVIPGTIDEASGIADSKKNTGYLWIEQDSGNPPELFLLSYDGTVLKKIYLKNATNRDWEDLSVGPGPVAGEDYVYIAETGDNSAVYLNYAIYRMIEPLASADTVSTFDKLVFEYPDGPHDVESVLVDHASKDIYLISKQDSLSKIYKLPYPQSTTTTNMAVSLGKMKFGGASGAAISKDGQEILVKTYTGVYYWKRNAGESIESALQRSPLSLGYVLEPQGEALCFRNDSTGFYTLSEKPFFAASVSLNFYKRR